jgi:hypothetical protein
VREQDFRDCGRSLYKPGYNANHGYYRYHVSYGFFQQAVKSENQKLPNRINLRIYSQIPVSGMSGHGDLL